MRYFGYQIRLVLYMHSNHASERNEGVLQVAFFMAFFSSSLLFDSLLFSFFCYPFLPRIEAPTTPLPLSARPPLRLWSTKKSTAKIDSKERPIREVRT